MSTNEQKREGNPRIILPTSDHEWGLPLPNTPEQVAASGYSDTYITHGTLRLDRMFGLDMREPGEITEEAAYQLRFALLFSPMQAETMRVAEHFVWWAQNFNMFHALPVLEIEKATGGAVTRGDIDGAVDEGYVSIVDYRGFGIHLAQMTPKFGSYTLPHDRRDLP